MRINHRSLLTAVALLNACTWLPSKDGEAIALIQGQLDTNSATGLMLPIGQVDVIDAGRQTHDPLKNQIALHVLSWYPFLEKEKWLSILSQSDLTSNNNFSWGNFADVSQRGVVRRLNVEAPSKSFDAFPCPKAAQGTGRAMLCINMGRSAVDEIVRSERFEIGTKSMWLLMGTLGWHPSAIVKKKVEWKIDSEVQKNFIAIALFDPFGKRWTIHESDFDTAPRSAAFVKQAHFDQVLASVRLFGRGVSGK